MVKVTETCTQFQGLARYLYCSQDKSSVGDIVLTHFRIFWVDKETPCGPVLEKCDLKSVRIANLLWHKHCIHVIQISFCFWWLRFLGYKEEGRSGYHRQLFQTKRSLRERKVQSTSLNASFKIHQKKRNKHVIIIFKDSWTLVCLLLIKSLFDDFPSIFYYSHFCKSNTSSNFYSALHGSFWFEWLPLDARNKSIWNNVAETTGKTPESCSHSVSEDSISFKLGPIHEDSIFLKLGPIYQWAAAAIWPLVIWLYQHMALVSFQS